MAARKLVREIRRRKFHGSMAAIVHDGLRIALKVVLLQVVMLVPDLAIGLNKVIAF